MVAVAVLLLGPRIDHHSILGERLIVDVSRAKSGNADRLEPLLDFRTVWRLVLCTTDAHVDAGCPGTPRT